MEQSKAMEYESQKASSDVLKPRNIYIYSNIYSKGNKTVPGKVATTHTEDGHKQDT